jgi:hypothetical protein
MAIFVADLLNISNSCQKCIIILHKIKLEKNYFVSSLQKGGRSVSYANSRRLMFCEFSFLKMLVMGKIILLDAEI